MTLPSNLPVSQSYIQWSLGTNRGIMAHLYAFTSASGTSDYFTDFDQDLTVNGITWKSQALRFEGLQRKLAIGLSVDEQTLKIWASPTDTLFGANFLTNAQQGLLDGAVIVRYRVIWQFVTGNVASDVAQTPLAFFPLFTGYMSSIVKGGTSHLEFKVKSALVKLNVNMPRNYFQPGCLWTLYSGNCTVVKSVYAVTGVVDTGVNSRGIPIVGGLTAIGLDGNPEYAQGRLLFTSGVNSGLLVLVDNNDSTFLYLAYVLNNLPTPGDTVTFYPGCSKTFDTCLTKFDNARNFRGFDKVPPIMVSV